MADYASLQKLALSDKGPDEAVTVNQRALIDKILARYASDNTTLRELLQNADDANATLVKIHYMSLSPVTVPLESLSAAPCRRLQVSNNGTAFRQEDWTRLKRIAEGNPDAEKIGAFGVGFYSVFSICDDPFVSSGKECMAFYWNDRDQLFVRRRELDKEEDMTTFMLNMRTPSEIPNMPELCRFLATSLTFTRSLATIELHFDNYKLLTLNRQVAPDGPITLSPSTLNLTSPKRSMQLTSATLQPIQIKATYLSVTQHIPPQITNNSFKKLFSRLNTPIPLDLSSQKTAIAFLRIATAKLSISIGSKFAAEFERAQKKPPPRETKLSMLCISKAEYDASTHNDPVFQELIPRKQGRVYIGFPTHQSTGFGGHIGAPALVPTVERESIDLADPQLRVWNGELLGCVGIFARVLYNLEMENISRRFNSKAQEEDSVLLDEAIHLLNLFTFHNTTPSAKVRQYIEETFFASSKDASVLLLTNKGVKSSNLVRLAPRDLPFLIDTPLLSEKIVSGAKGFIDRLREGDILKVAGWEDVKKELNGRTLSETHAVQFLKWLLAEKLPADKQRQLLGLAVIVIGDETNGKIANLAEVKNFLVPGRIPIDGSLPLTVLPPEITKTFSIRDLESFGWEELSIHDWIAHICTTPGTSPSLDLEQSSSFATAVLATISKNWDSIPPNERTAILSLLSSKKCMPTIKKGLMKPSDTYFHTVKVLPDLPLVESIKGVKEKFLELLGVRRVVALQLIFERLGEGGAWSHIDGIKYLASVQNNLKPEEVQKLREFPLCPSRRDKKRMLVSQLYEPSRDLEKLDLPILSWPMDSWKSFSAEARFLYSLGLNRYPSAVTLVKMAANPSNTSDQRNHILDFYTTFYHTYEYNRTNLSEIHDKFLPCEPIKGKEVVLFSPSEIYSNPACQVFGFNILDKRYLPESTKFGVKSDPSPTALEGLLVRRPPTTLHEAKEKFAYLAQRITTFSSSQLLTLSRSKIIPIQNKGSIKYVPPHLCFIDSHEEKEQIWEDIFDFVDFGREGNIFLEALGCKDRPDPSQIAEQLTLEPKRIYDAMDLTGYLRLLALLGTNITSLQRNRQLWTRLKEAPFLLGLATTKATDDDGGKTVATLARAQDIVIMDEPRLGVIFRSDLVVAPERDDCEALYLALGSPHLSSLVRQKYRYRGNPVTNSATESLKKHILERSGIFLTLPEISPQVKKSNYLAETLKVYSYKSILVERLLSFGRIRSSNSEKVTAVVDSSTRGLLLTVTDPGTVNYNQVAEALNSVVLKKTNRGTDLMFETILKENLDYLRFRGFAVDRLLNRHLEEKRLAKAKAEAEEAERRKAEMEQRRIEAERASQVAQVAREGQRNGQLENMVANGNAHRDHVEKKTKIPGAWQDDQDEPPAYTPPEPEPEPQHQQELVQHQPPARQPDRSSGFMNSIRNALGIQDPLHPQSPSQQHQEPQGQTPHYPTSKSSIDNQLSRAINAVRPFSQNSIFTPATNSIVQEAPQSYCDSTEAQDLQVYDNAPTWGLGTFYVPSQRSAFDSIIATKTTEITSFATLLKRLAGVYSVREESFHLFWDPRGKTIAFNLRGSLFFNIAYFLELHQRREGGYTRDAPVYWFTVIAHELAHNMVHAHGAEHSYWTEAFVSSYMLRLWERFASG